MSTASPSGDGLRLRPIKSKTETGTETPSAGSKNAIEEPVTPVGRMFQEEKMNCYILCIVGFKTEIDLQHMKEVLLQTLLKHPRFTSSVEKYGTSKPKWKHVTVDVDYHVQEAPVSEGHLNSSTCLEDFTSSLADKPSLDPSRPLWEAFILNTQRPDSIGHCIFRIHHSLGGGIPLMALLLACTRQVAMPDRLPTFPGQQQESKLGKLAPHSSPSLDPEQLSSASGSRPQKARQNFLQSILRGLAIVVNTNIYVWQFLAMVVGIKDSATAVKASPGTEKESHKLVFSEEISLDDVAIVRRSIGDATINDVIMAIIAGGLNLYLSNTQSGPVKLEKARVRGLALVNLRKPPDLQELESMMATGSHVPWGNHVGYMMVPLAVGPFSDPLDRVRKMKVVIDNKKLSYEALVSYVNATVLSVTAGSKVVAKLTYRALNQTTLAISNVVGPVEEVSLGGYPISFIVPSVSGTPQSLTVHAQTYKGGLRIAALAAMTYVPDPQLLCQCFLDSFAEMRKAAADQ